VLLKSCVIGKEPSGMLYDNTAFDTEVAAACCRGGEFSLLSDGIAGVLNPAYDSGQLAVPLGISTKCDLAFYKEIAAYAAKAPKLIRKYVKYEADHTNYISYLRAFSTGLPADTFRKMLLPGGFIPESVFAACYEAKPESVRPYTFGYETHYGIVKAEEAAKNSINAASDALDAATEALLEYEKYEINSPVPVFLYYKKKIREARLIRTYFTESEALWKRR
jgi:vacuolar-type H+-ATPase subunit C/Vma6